MPNYLGTRRILKGFPQGLNTSRLLPFGPFVALTPPSVASLSDLAVIGTTVTVGSGQTQSNPLKYNILSLQLGGLLNLDGSTFDLWTWTNRLLMRTSSSIDTSGQDGTNAFIEDPSSGPVDAGNGGNGSAGGGGGGAASNNDGTNEPGGDGGGTNGVAGAGQATQDGFAAAGVGGLSFSSYPYNFAIALSGNGGNGAIGEVGGTAGNGLAGGGAGGAALGNAADFLGGGGGGGSAGNQMHVTTWLDCDATANGMFSIGGNGGQPYQNTVDEPGSGGGGGTINIWTPKKTGVLPYSLLGGAGFSGGGAGSIQLWEIKKNGLLVLHTNANDVWNNL